MFKLSRQSALTLLMAFLATATMLLISEMNYWRAASTLEAVQNPAEAAQARAAIHSVLVSSRIGVAVLSAVCLLALFFYWRQALVLQHQQRSLKQLMQADHQRLEAEVARRTAELTELASHLLTAREDERARLARDLHDELGSLLSAAKLDAARLRARLGDHAPEAQLRLASLVRNLNGVVALKRLIVEDLRPSSLALLGLVPTLESLAREFGARSGLQVHCTLQPVPLGADAELVVYRVVQEAITNISKHAQASQLWLALHMAEGEGGAADAVVVATVRDDGQGFSPQNRPGSAHGLMGMRFRVQAAGGRLTVNAAPGQGTCIHIALPAAARLTAVPEAMPAL